jgi:two-component system cell cycle response regulator
LLFRSTFTPDDSPELLVSLDLLSNGGDVSGSYALIAISQEDRAAVFCQIVFEKLSLETVLVGNGEDALHKIARRGAPTLLLIDLALPDIDGFAVIRTLRRQPTEPDTRIIVVAAHESARTARELAGSLGISWVLPLDADPTALIDLLQAIRETERDEESTEPTAARAAIETSVADVIDRAAIEARRRCRMPMSIGYLKVGEDENRTFHVAARGGGPAITIGDVAEFRFLRQVAEAGNPLVISNVEHHPVFAQFLQNGSRPVRGFAAIPILTSHESIRAAFCVLDATPLALTAAEVEALTVFGSEVGVEIDRVLSPDQRPISETKAPISDSTSEEVRILQQLAATDPLTGLSNRRGGEAQIASEISRAKREQRPLSCLLLDIDRFKDVNDTFGHQAGDQLLRDVSNLLRRTVRAYDILVRWGGDEFLIVLPGADINVARALAERVRTAVEALDTRGIGSVTISAGVTTFDHGYDFTDTLKVADRCLYQAKAGGRNCVV